MDRKKLLRHLVFLMFFIFLADILAKQFYWYFSIWYFDILMHFLGGIWLGLFFLWFFSIKNLSSLKWLLNFDGFQFVYQTVLFVLFIGVLWEFFEFYTINYISQESFNVSDTISDIFFDLAGAFTAIFYFLRKIMIGPENEVQLK